MGKGDNFFMKKYFNRLGKESWMEGGILQGGGCNNWKKSKESTKL
jgi:hypothetical protein